MFDVLNLFDTEFTIYVSIISVISIILLYFILRMFLSHSRKLRILFLSIIVYVFLFLVGITIYYVNTNEYIFYTENKYYVQGRIVEVSDNYLIVSVINSNLNSGGRGKLKVKLTDRTVYSIYANSKETKVNLDDIITNSNVEIVCKESNALNGQVTAMKVQRRIY